ncbi:MAG: T9SS type A sorting domain-containing protein, partial [Chitinophagales bacterium]
PVIVGLSPSVSDFSSSPNGNTYIFFTGASQTTNSPTNWEWDFGDGTPLTSGTSTTHTYTAEGTYNVCVTVSNQFNAICGDPLASFCKSVLVGGSGINDKELDATINIYPNPNTGKFEVTIADTKASDLNISITNMIGETIVTSNITVNGSTTETFDLGQKASGVYFVTIASEDAATTERVIVR